MDELVKRMFIRGSGEIVAFTWGKRDLKTANKLRKRLKGLGITYGRIATFFYINYGFV
jgi:IS1 family transposase